jgi:hypothetical protein
MTAKSPVDTWFAELRHPLEPVMLRLRETFLGAEERISALVICRTSMLVAPVRSDGCEPTSALTAVRLWAANH